jgi:glucose-6-phosphate isomerase
LRWIKQFFIRIITILRAKDDTQIEVDSSMMTSGDYLNSFALRTMRALCENKTEVIQIAIDKLSAYELGMLITFYERTVGFYAPIRNTNAHHQSGVESGKEAAAEILQTQRFILSFLQKNKSKRFTISGIADGRNSKTEKVLIFILLEHISFNGISVKKTIL